jgi:hypothetical protein
MTRPRTMTDRCRIEYAVWRLDNRLRDLPFRSAMARRQELRQNLRAAADEVGGREAVRQLGDLRVLAAEYLAAEYGDVAPRPSWNTAMAWIGAVDIFLVVLGQAGSAAFRAGVAATTPNATGTFHWHGVSYLINDTTFTYTEGTATSLGGAWTLWAWILMFGGAVLAGRLWRMLPWLRRRPS